MYNKSLINFNTRFTDISIALNWYVSEEIYHKSAKRESFEENEFRYIFISLNG